MSVAERGEPMPIWDCGHPQHSQREGCPDPDCWRHRAGERPVSTLGPNLTERDLDMRLGGFADAEGLMLAMVGEMQEKEKDKEADAIARLAEQPEGLYRTMWEIVVQRHRDRAQVLEELELALRMGQHRVAEYGDRDLAPDQAREQAAKLARAHQQMANGLRGGKGSGKASEGGRKASDGMTKDERVRRARNAAESRYNGKPGTKSKKGGVE